MEPGEKEEEGTDISFLGSTLASLDSEKGQAQACTYFAGLG